MRARFQAKFESTTVDLLRQAGLSSVAVTITGGETASHEGGIWRVPKRDLVSTLQVLLQAGCLKLAEELPEANVLVKELLGFQVKITSHAHDIYGAWREGAHDDLVLATALACWYGERMGGKTMSITGVPKRSLWKIE